MCINAQITRIWIRPIVIILYTLLVIIVVPLLIVNSVKDGFSRKDQLILIGGLFVLSALPISFWHITQHVIHFTKPILQKHIIRILWMVPIYALNAWLGLIFPDHSIYMNSIRECYEAYVIYNFMKYLLNYLNLEMDLEATLEFKPPVKHIFPLCCLTPWTMGREFVHNCKHGILQYTIVRPITTFISVICELNGVYGEGLFQGNVAFPYIVAVNNVSQFTAMYCLVLFYQANKVELKPMRPLPKFLCIKAVVFFSFFQGLMINILVYFGFIKNIFGSDEDDDYKLLSSKLQDFLICIEMFLAALAHQYSFPHDPFHINIPHYDSAGVSWYNAFIDMWDISDVHQDVSEHIGVVGSSLSRRFRGRSMYSMTRGGDSYVPTTIGTERELLVNTTGADCYQSDVIMPSSNSQSLSNLAANKNRYGALSTTASSQKDSNNLVNLKNNDAINIVKPKDNNQKEYTPNEGLPKMNNLFNFSNYNPPPSSSSASTINRPLHSQLMMSNSDISEYDTLSSLQSDNINTFTRTTSSTSGELNVGNNPNIRKSDSNSSDWLSTPTDEIIGIDVKGMNNDQINYRDPNT